MFSSSNPFYPFSDLCSNGTIFEVDEAEGDFSDFDSSDDELGFQSEILKSPWEASFLELKKNMYVINEHVYKMITKPGFGDKPEENCHYRFTIHYNAFLEGETSPFDSTYLRGKPMVFIQCSEVLQGIAKAVYTMHKGEEAQFWFSYKVAYKEMGCPPRIPPKSDLLFVISLLNVEEIGDEHAFEKLSKEDQNKFKHVKEKANAVYLHGIDSFKGGRLTSAKISFHKAVTGL